MIYILVLLHRRDCPEWTAVFHGIASLVDRPHDVTQQWGEQIGHLLHRPGS